MPAEVDVELAKALSHPLRRRILVHYCDGDASPSDVAARLVAPVGTVAYHTKCLLERGLLELVGTDRRRGGLAHIYRATVSYQVEDEGWRDAAPERRRSLALPTLDVLWDEVERAAHAGAFERDDMHLSRVPLDLDDAAWSELSSLLRTLVDQAQRLERESAARGDDRRTRPALLAMLCFER